MALRLHSLGVIVYAGVMNDEGEGAERLKAEGCKVVKVDVTKDAYVLKAAEFIKDDLGDKSKQKVSYIAKIKF